MMRLSGRVRAASMAADQVLGALAPEPIEPGEDLRVEAEDVGRLLHELPLDELDHDLEAQAVDVQASTAAEVEQATDALRRAVRVRAACHDLALLALGARPTYRARRRHLPRHLVAIAGIHDRAHDLGDHVACALEDDRVADPQVLAPDLVDVVERCVAHGRATHEHRGDVGDRGHGTGPAHVHLDRLELRGDLLGRELVGGRPARCA